MRRSLAAAIAAVMVLPIVPAVSASAAEPMTTLTMTVRGCEGCTITPSTFRRSATGDWTGTRVKVVNGVATLVVPTSQTPGMAFAIDAPWRVEINAQPYITMQYKGATPGGTVTRAQAIAAKKGTACWAGTSDPTAALTVRVSRVLMPAFPDGDHKTRVPLAWVTPTSSSPGGYSPAYQGVIASQDVWVCP
jgi:hypothetical protein